MGVKGRTAARARSGSSKSGGPSRMNPFELKFNRIKHRMLGKAEKNATSVGKPSSSKKKAFEKRVSSLAFEWNQFGKTNKIVDRRLAERDSGVTEEEKVSKRFAAERKRQLASSDEAFPDENAHEVELTHKGSSLTSIQKYEKVVSDDEEGDDAIGADVVSIAHFGGGLPESPHHESVPDASAKRKDMIAEVIARTKQERFDKKMARDEQEDATERLDERWKELLVAGAIGTLERPSRDVDNDKPNHKPQLSVADKYDILFHELQTDSGRRGEAKEREKTEDEIAAEEREALVDLEAARLFRLEGVTKPKLRGDEADCDRTSSLSGARAEKRFEVKYGPDGKMLDPHKVERACIRVVRIDDETSDYDKTVSDTVDEWGEGEEDLEAMLENDEQLRESAADTSSRPSPSQASTQQSASGEEVRTVGREKELPFVFKMPDTYEQLKGLLSGDTVAMREATVIARLVKCYHPSLREGNKKRLARLFLLLLRYFDEISSEGAEHTVQLGQIVNGLFVLLKFNVEYGVRCVRALVRQQRRVHFRERGRSPPTFGVVSTVALVGALFPSSDLVHPVCTPCFQLAASILASARVSTPKDAARILLLLTALSTYVECSKRYIPEAIAFLRGLLLMAVENGDDERSPTATFPVSMPHRRMLYVSDNCSALSSPLLVNAKAVFSSQEASFPETDDNRLSVVRAAIAVTAKFVLIYSTHSQSFGAIFGSLLRLVERLPRNRYPKLLSTEVDNLECSIKAECDKCARQPQLRRPVIEKKMLEMLEPRIENKFDAERPHAQKGRLSERRLLNRKYKKEVRGAVRELRKDNRFLAREKSARSAENDAVRRNKTKMLMNSLQGQESDYKKRINLKKTTH